MKKRLFLMCGCPGAGKSTWLKNHAQNAIVVSRDKIRFKLVNEDEEYFSKEKKVFKTFISEIQNAIDDEKDFKEIYCDATHITNASRNKILKALNLSNVENITVLVFYPSLDETLRRNSLREGRKKVPEKVIRQMYNSFQRPEDDENRIFDVIYKEVPKEWETFI